MASVRVEDRDGTAVVTMDHPPANALDPEFLAEGLAVLDRLGEDEPAAVVLTGTGAFFSGGANLRVVPDLSPAEQAEMARGVNRLFHGWHTLARPLVTAVNGHAVAGGLILALCGDHRIVGNRGQFGLTEVKVGIPYPSEAMAVVLSELTPAVARRLVLRGELVDATTALDLGLFDETVDDVELLARALEVATDLAALPPATFATVKRRLRAASRPTTTGLEGGADAIGWATAEAPDAARRVLDER